MIRLLALALVFLAYSVPAHALVPKQIAITISYNMKDVSPDVEYIKAVCGLFKDEIPSQKVKDYGDVVLDHGYTVASGEADIWKKGQPFKGAGDVTVNIPIGDAKASKLAEAHAWGCGLYFNNTPAGIKDPPSENSKFTNWVHGKYP